MIPLYSIVITDILGLLIIFYLLIGICTICRVIIYRPMEFEFTVKEKIWIFITVPLYVCWAFSRWIQLSLRYESDGMNKIINILRFFYRLSELSDAYVVNFINQIEERK